MAYIKFKELTKYFDFKESVLFSDLPDYVVEYMDGNDKYLMAYKNRRDYALFTNNRVFLFDRDFIAGGKKVHVIPYHSISTSAIVYEPSKTKILMSMDSGYQVRIDFIHTHHEEKEILKMVFKQINNHHL